MIMKSKIKNILEEYLYWKTPDGFLSAHITPVIYPRSFSRGQQMSAKVCAEVQKNSCPSYLIFLLSPLMFLLCSLAEKNPSSFSVFLKNLKADAIRQRWEKQPVHFARDRWDHFICACFDVSKPLWKKRMWQASVSVQLWILCLLSLTTERWTIVFSLMYVCSFVHAIS